MHLHFRSNWGSTVLKTFHCPVESGVSSCSEALTAQWVQSGDPIQAVVVRNAPRKEPLELGEVGEVGGWVGGWVGLEVGRVWRLGVGGWG